MLDSLGLDEFTENTYRYLVAHPPATVGELSQHLQAGDPRVRRAVDHLVAHGLVFPEPGRAGRYAAVDPRVGLGTLIHSRRLELERATAALDSYAAEYHERLLRTEPERLVEVIEGPATITARLDELMAGAKEEVLAFDAPPYVTPDATASAAERELLARGVRVRAVYASEVLAIDERADRLRDLVLLGERARVVPRVPLKMVVIDGRDALLPLSASTEGTRSTAALVHRSQLCTALVALFETTWEQATPVFAAETSAGSDTSDISDSKPAQPHPEVSPSEQALLHLLNVGLKDDAIARQLGISERTFRRRVTDLTARLGATSRFQAGAQAVRRGWL